MATRSSSTSLEHVGIAASDAPHVLGMLERLLGHAPYKEERVAREGVVTHFLHAGAAKLEVLESIRPDSPVGRFLEKRGEGVHHLAFDVADIDAVYDEVRVKGFEPLSDAPRPGADGKRIFFLHPSDTCGLLIEFCQQTQALPPPQRVVSGEASLAVYELGRAEHPPLVVLHGLGGSTETEMTRLIRRLEPRFHVLALDFAGHGKSNDPADRPLTFDLLTDNVAAVQNHFGLAQTHLFGFSLGGSVALYYAQRFPSRVGRLAAHATNVVWDEALAEAVVRRLRRSTSGAEPPKPRHERCLTFASRLPAHADIFEVGDIATPVLLSACDQDDLLPLHQVLQLYRRLPESRLAVVPGSRHSMSALSSESYPPLITEWLTASAT